MKIFTRITVLIQLSIFHYFFIYFGCLTVACTSGTPEVLMPITAGDTPFESAGMIPSLPEEMMSGEVTSGEVTSGEVTSGEVTSGEMSAGFIQSGEEGGIEGGWVGATTPIDCGALTACGIECVDLQNDPNHCGGCGRTCRIPQAQASCLNGSCSIGSCQPSYLDADGQIENGCELLNDCEEGSSCITECASEGVTICVTGVSQCQVPQESCNLLDDDCDAACDEGWRDLGCRVGIHRGYGQGEHIYSNQLSLVNGDGHQLEAENFFYLYQETIPNGRPVFFCRNRDQRPFLSTQTDCGIQRAPLATLGFWLATPSCGASPLYALFKPDSGDFFYTIRAMERDYAVGLGYQDQGIAGYIWID